MKIENILLPTDFSEASTAALDQALLLAQKHGARLHILHAIVLQGGVPAGPDLGFPSLEELHQKLEELSARDMDALLAERNPGNLEVIQTRGRAFAAAPAIVEYADEQSIDLIVMSTHGRRGLRHFLLGSVTEEVVRTAPCPVLTLRGAEAARGLKSLARILVPFDFSEGSEKGLAAAEELARIDGSHIDLVHVVEPPMDPEIYVPMHDRHLSFGYRELSGEVRTTLQAKLQSRDSGCDTEIHIFDGSAAHSLVDAAEDLDSDLIVMASHGRTGLQHFLLGSVAEKVVRAATCPVLTLRWPKPAMAGQNAA